MSFLQNLKIIASKRPCGVLPLQHRRNKLVKRLHEQLECAHAKIEGKDYFLTRMRSRKNKETGERFQMELQYRPAKWWYTNAEGKLIFEVKYGSRVIELSKGRTGIEVSTLADLPGCIELVKKAVETGELDEAIASVIGDFGRGVKK